MPLKASKHSFFKDSQEALNALKIYGDHLPKEGKILPEISIVLGSKGLKGEDPYQGRVMIVHKGFYLFGVAGFIKEEVGENLLVELIRNITRGR